MQFKLRSVNTKFWEDPFIEELKPEEKLLFLYILTNPLTNIIGCYEITVKRMSYDTGLTPERVQKSLKVFEEHSKVFYIENYVLLPNFLKNQNLNTNMQIGAMKIYNDLPNWLRDNISSKPLKAFESLRNAMLNMNMNMNVNVNDNKNVNIEYEEEEEKEEGVIFPFDSEEFLKWWNYWKDYKKKEFKFKYASNVSEQAALKKLSEMSNGKEEVAIKIIEQSIAGGWKGFFELTKSNRVTKTTIQDNLDYFDRKKAAGDYD